MLKRFIYAIIIPIVSVVTVAILAISLGYIFYNVPTLGPGEGELKKITFSDASHKESKEILEDLILAAHNDAKLKLKKKTSEEISKVTGGIDLPPGFKLPF